MNLLNMVQQWREQRDAIPTEKIKTLGLIGGMGSHRRQPMDAGNPFLERAPIKPLSFERAEHRVNISGTAMLIGRHGKLGVEQAAMQNVSSRGVRLISGSEWYVDDTILVSLPAGHFTSAARVAYCDAVAEGRFAIGLEFVGSNQPLDLSALVP
jgi:PilZ domain